MSIETTPKLSVVEKRQKANEIVKLLVGLRTEDALDIIGTFCRVQINGASTVNETILPELV
jgi:hypothetical protein